MLTAPAQEPKVNLTRLLRQVQNQEDQEKFSHKHGSKKNLLKENKIRN